MPRGSGGSRKTERSATRRWERPSKVGGLGRSQDVPALTAGAISTATLPVAWPLMLASPALSPGCPYPLEELDLERVGSRTTPFFSHSARRQSNCASSTRRGTRPGSSCLRLAPTYGMGYLEEAEPGQLYGYRVHGHYDPGHGPAGAEPRKLLLDPYAKAVAGEVNDGARRCTATSSPRRDDRSMDWTDSAASMPKAIVVELPPSSRGDDRRPRTPWQDTVIYETR